MKKIFYSVLILMVCLIVTGCNCMKKTPKSAVEDFLNQYKSLNSNVMQDLEDVIQKESIPQELKDEYRNIMKKQYRDLKYKIIDETYDGDNAIVKVKIKVYDLYKAQNEATDYLNHHLDEFKTDEGSYDNSKYLIYKLDKMKETNKTVEYTLELDVEKNSKGKWEVSKLSSNDLEKIHGIYNYEEE